MEIIENIKLALEKATIEKKRAATFHSMVLLHADELEEYDAKSFCREVGAKETYQTEFHKMLAVARTLSDLGYSIQKHKE